jgi:nucleoid-associated protein YgaU
VAGLTVQFSEQDVQAELERIAAEHVQRNEWDAAAAACEQLAADYPESKWLGNALLMAAACYRELGQPAGEMRALERFLASCPDHPQAPAARRALQTLQAREGMHGVAAEHSAAIESLEKRVGAVIEAIESVKQSQSTVEQLSAAVDHLTRRLEEIDSTGSSVLSSTIGGGAQPTTIELLNAVVQDVNAETEAQRQRMETRLGELDRRIAEVSGRSVLIRSARNMATAALLGSLLSLMVIIDLYDNVQGGSGPRTLQPAHMARALPVHPSHKTPSGPGKAIARVVIDTVAAQDPRLQTATPVPQTKHALPQSPPQVSTANHDDGSKRLDPKLALRAASRPPAPRFHFYTVKPSDTLWGICKKEVGSGKALEKIAAINGLSPPYNLRPGRTLRFPE